MMTSQLTAPQPFRSTPANLPKRAEVDELQVAIRDALSHSGYRELRSLDLESDGKAITISGRVPTYYLKQLVQSIALAAPGIRQVNNDVRVC